MSEHRRKTDSNMWAVIRVVLALLLGGGLTSGGMQFLSPTNSVLQEEVHVLQNQFDGYVIAHEREVELNNKYIENELKHIAEDIKEIKELIKNGNK